MTYTYTTLFETPPLALEERSDGVLCLTNDAVVSEPITRQVYAGWDADHVREEFADEGVPADLIDRIMGQLGDPDADGFYR